MQDTGIDEISNWILRQGLAGASETDLMHGFCERAAQAGLALASAVTVVDTLHPIWEGRAFLWRNDGVEEESMIEYGSTRDGEAAERWQRSAFYHLMKTGGDELRRRIGGANRQTLKCSMNCAPRVIPTTSRWCIGLRATA